MEISTPITLQDISQLFCNYVSISSKIRQYNNILKGQIRNGVL